MPPKKEGEKHYYGFDSSGLEKAATVSIKKLLSTVGCQIPGPKSER